MSGIGSLTVGVAVIGKRCTTVGHPPPPSICATHYALALRSDMPKPASLNDPLPSVDLGKGRSEEARRYGYANDISCRLRLDPQTNVCRLSFNPQGLQAKAQPSDISLQAKLQPSGLDTATY